jgi:peptidoglycan/LPS O-acetylase OafA/YrhL
MVNSEGYMSKFLPYILYLRGAAILVVVSTHARGNLSDWSSHDTHRLLATVFEGREGAGTALFIFIGGFLFQYLTHNNFNFGKYLEKKFLYVILPYIVISIPMIPIRIYTNYTFNLPPGFNEQPVLYQTIYYLLTGLHFPPLWFIAVIMIFYISSPIFHALDRPKAYQYIFPFLFVAGLFTYRAQDNANPMLSYIHYIPIYLLGMWTSYYRDRLFSVGRWILWPLVIGYAGIVIAHLTGWLPVMERTSFQEVIQQRLLLFNLDRLRTIMLCFIAVLSFYQLRDKKLPFFELLGEYSFGIFFVHCLFLFSTRKIWDALGPTNFTLMTYMIYFGVILLISIVSVYLVKKIAGRYSRNLIGS